MSQIAIKADSLSKCYHIYATPRDRLKQFFMPGLRRMLGLPEKLYARDFWAVRDVSFDVERGQTVGIIGRNGSGKSTLLQIICGTLTPTGGSVEVNGRVAALLELGSGFNPEFTGRENVYLNGSVYGLRRDSIDAKMKDILDFADIGDFIDQPVKTYSSGMFVRLAFSVVMHVDPEILIVDEALSVGDAFFQSKCAAAIRAMMKKGTTVLFVSHDTHAVKSLCNKAILMEEGRIVAYGDSADVVEKYYSSRVGAGSPSALTSKIGTKHSPSLSRNTVGDTTAFLKRADYQRVMNGKVSFLNVSLLDEAGCEISVAEFRQRVTLRMVIEAIDELPCLGVAYHIRDMKGVELVYSDTGVENGSHLRDLVPGRLYVVDWTFNAALQDGEYNFSAMASIPLDMQVGQVDVCDFVPFALQFRVARGMSLPIYAATHWENDLSISSIE
jgi:lipopolysaccharide transport system ATP-binding protein